MGLEGGGEFKGLVEEGRREGECKTTSLQHGIRLLQASYYRDLPEGFTTIVKEDGGWMEGFTMLGKWDGMVREFTSERVATFIGR